MSLPASQVSDSSCVAQTSLEMGRVERIEIRPNTTLGFLPLGEMTEEILDSNQSKAVTSDARQGATWPRIIARQGETGLPIDSGAVLGLLSMLS